MGGLSVDRIDNVFQRRYDVLDKLGSGGMGMVYRVRSRDLGAKEYALKIVDKSSPENSGVDIYTEIQILKSLKHPNIVTIFEAMEDERYVYIIQEYINGRTLAEIRDNPATSQVIDEEVAKLWMIDIADALAYIHSQGIVHRDIKPGNIMIDSDGVARLIDFGIARRVSTINKTRSGSTVGSAPYSPLERLEGAADGVQTDIYAFGTTFYSLIRKIIPSISGREINTLRSSNRSIKPYYMNAYRTMINDLENIQDDGIRELIRSCIDIDPRRRVREFNTVRYMLSSMGEVQKEQALRKKESRNKRILLSLLLILGIALAGFGAVQMKRDHAHRYDKIIAAADEAYRSSDYYQSEKDAIEAIDFDPHNEAGYITKYKAITAAAYEYNNSKEYERLISEVQSDTTGNQIGDNLYVATYLANAYFETDRLDKAIEVLSGREDLEDNQLMLLGHAFFKKGDGAKASKCLDRMNTDTPQKYYLEGLINHDSNSAAAIAAYERVLGYDAAETLTGDLRRKALTQICNIYINNQEYAKATEKIKVEMDKDVSLKDSILVNQMLMDCYYRAQDFGNAIAQASTVIERFGLRHAYEIKTSSEENLRDFDAALATIEKWKEAYPDDPGPHIRRALIYNNIAGASNTDAERDRTYPDYIRVYEEEREWLLSHDAMSSEFETLEKSYRDAVSYMN